MQEFLIHESNLEILKKKLQSIQNKCNKNQVSFIYREVGEEFVETKSEDGKETYTARYIRVEVEGAVKHNGWEFVAVIDHHDAGNVIRAYKTDIEVPEKYRTCGPTCEHCNKIRSRKDTYLIYNAEQNQFKQVGKSCLKEYTNGLDAEQVAFMMQWYQKLEDSKGYTGIGYTRYLERDLVLNYAFECYHHFGYEKVEDNYGNPNEHSTRGRVHDYMNVFSLMPRCREKAVEEMNEVGFDANSEYAKQMTEDAVKWIVAAEETNNYISNLRIICSQEWVPSNDFGLLVSLPAAYGRFLQNKAYEEKKAAEASAEAASSEYQGEVGQRIAVELESATCLTTLESIYGTTWMYKFIDKSGNVYIWYASTPIDTDNTYLIYGTVKKHEEYRGVKQTVLTRCKAQK